jgi:ankyrin repeat protein
VLADVNYVDHRGHHVLHVALSRQHAAVVQLLLEHGAAAAMNSVVRVQHLSTGYDITAMMMCDTVDTVKVLLAAGADVHVTTAAGDTCLHSAAELKRPVPVICLLIKAGADLHAVNNEGKTAAQLAHERGCTLIAQLLNRAAQQQEH